MANSEFSDFKKLLTKLGLDVELSATQILDKSIELFYNYFQSIEEIPNNFQEEISSLLPSLHPEMSNFEKLIEIFNEIKEPWTKSKLNLSLIKIIEDISLNKKESIKSLIEELRKKRVENIITISYSKLVFDSIIEYEKSSNLERLIISSSSPKYEGVTFANDLRKKLPTHEIILVDDPRIANYLSKYHEKSVVLIGCDSIFPDGSVLNKSGSLSLAVLSKHYNIPFYVIATNFKRRNTAYFDKMIRSQKLHELPWYDEGLTVGKIIIENKLFDQIPRDLITIIFF